MALVFILVMFCQVCSALQELNPDRWEYIDGNSDYENCLDKNKLYFYRENGNNYADVWTLSRDTDTGKASLHNFRINLDKKELQSVELVFYNYNGTLLNRAKLNEKVHTFEKINPEDRYNNLVFKKVYEIYEPISKRDDRDKVFAELKAKADGTEIYAPQKVTFTLIDPESDRWCRVDDRRSDDWLDAQKMWFFTEDGEIYADVWKARDTITTIEIEHFKFNLSKNEYERLSSITYYRDGSKSREMGPFSMERVSAQVSYTFGAVLKIYNAINTHKDKEKILAELKAEAFNTRAFNPLDEFLYKSQKPQTPVLVKYNIIPSHHKFLDPPIMAAGGVGICAIIVLIGIYFHKRRKDNLTGETTRNGKVNLKRPGQPSLGITLDDIPKLKKMLDDGIITQEEFNVAKKKLLE